MFEDRERMWWGPISHFAGHIVIGSLLFCIFAAPAIGFAIAVSHLKSLGVPDFTVTVLTFLEHTILITDALLFLVYTFVACAKAIREMIL